MDLEQQRSTRGADRVYEFSGYELDLYEGSLMRDGNKLALPPRTIQVLQLLIERKGEIVTKEEFFHTVWNGSFVEDNNLTVAITQLRKALGDNAKKAKFIETLPRRGYRFIADVTARESQSSKNGWHISNGRSAAEGIVAAVIAHENLKLANDARPSSKRLYADILLITLVSVFAFVMVGARIGIFPKTALAANRLDSIAIMPFETGDEASSQISEGLTYGIITNLSKLPGLSLINRDSTERFRGKGLDPSVIGRELTAKSVLTGRVEQHDDAVLVDLQLFDVASGQMIWQQRIRRGRLEAFSIQEELTRAIIQNLKFETTGAQDKQIASRKTNDPIAFDLYLKARFYWNKRQPASLEKAAELFKAATDRDPTFADAYVGLATSYTLGIFPGLGTDEQKNAVIRGYLDKALEIDDTLGEAYAARAINKCFYDWDFDGAAIDYQRAIESNPGNATSHHWYAEFLSMQGRFDESRTEYQKAMALDPLSLPIKTDMAYSYFYSRDYDRAIELLEQIKTMDPNFAPPNLLLWYVYVEKGMFREAINAREKYDELQFMGGSQTKDGYARSVDLNARLSEGFRTGGALGYYQAFVFGGSAFDNARFLLATTYAKLGDNDNAFRYLEKALKAHETSLVWIKVTPEIDNFRSDPRFQTILEQVMR